MRERGTKGRTSFHSREASTAFSMIIHKPKEECFAILFNKNLENGSNDLAENLHTALDGYVRWPQFVVFILVRQFSRYGRSLVDTLALPH